MNRERIWNWKARRSGAAITITGVDAQSKSITIKASQIDAGPAGAKPIAQAEDGQFYELA